VCQGKGIVDACQGLVRVPQYPEDRSGKGEDRSGKGSVANTQIVTYTEHWSTAMVWLVEGDAFL
jgi:hypothetical protein